MGEEEPSPTLQPGFLKPCCSLEVTQTNSGMVPIPCTRDHSAGHALPSKTGKGNSRWTLPTTSSLRCEYSGWREEQPQSMHRYPSHAQDNVGYSLKLLIHSASPQEGTIVCRGTCQPLGI